MKTMRRIVVLRAALASLAYASAAAGAAEMLLVEKDASRAPTVVAHDAPPETAHAAGDLADYIEKIGGARPAIIVGQPDPAPARAIWVGPSPKLAALLPDLKLDFQHPEEILIACDGRHLVIAGRDRVVEGTQIEHGTANAVYTFLQKHLGVRWLWPGRLGEDIVKRDTITVPALEYRFAPPFRQRSMRRRQYGPERERPTADWYRFQRIALHSLRMHAGHAFTDWWEKYHEAHPDYFALKPDGSRSVHRDPRDVKLCISNPRVWAQWLDNAEKWLRDHPAEMMVSASPNDSSGECVCEACRAWDHPQGPPITLYGKPYVALTDRHVKFWNILARGLKQRFPEREVQVGAWAYSCYRTPPMAEVLEPNIAIGFVGHFPLAGDEVRQREKDIWRGWARKASSLVFRPNLFWYSGGFVGLPAVAMRKTMEDFRFLAENRGAGIDVDSIPEYWATHGVQLYLMMQLAWDPLQDGPALLEDYYRRGFGPAAAAVARYFDLMEKAHDRITEIPGFRHSSGLRYLALQFYEAVYTDELLSQADELLREAEAGVTAAADVYRQRVAFLRIGLDFTRLQLQIMHTMDRVRESRGKEAEAVQRAIELCGAREELFRRGEDWFALNPAGFRSYCRIRKMDDYLGPPSASPRNHQEVPQP